MRRRSKSKHIEAEKINYRENNNYRSREKSSNLRSQSSPKKGPRSIEDIRQSKKFNFIFNFEFFFYFKIHIHNRIFINFLLELKYYQKKLKLYKEKNTHYEAILEKLCDISLVKNYDLLPATISRTLSKVHYSKYLENSKLYQKLKSQFYDLQDTTKKILDIYSDKSKVFDKLKNCMRRMRESFELNTRDQFMTESAVDENSSSDYQRWGNSTERSEETNDLVDYPVEKRINEVRDYEIKNMIDSVRFANELNLMAIEEFNAISNNLELVKVEEEECENIEDLIRKEEEGEESVEVGDDNYKILKEIEGKVKMLEEWVSSEI